MDKVKIRKISGKDKTQNWWDDFEGFISGSPKVGEALYVNLEPNKDYEYYPTWRTSTVEDVELCRGGIIEAKNKTILIKTRNSVYEIIYIN